MHYYLLGLTFFLLSIKISAQLNARYCCEDIFMFSECIDFYENGKFQYQTAHCFGQNKGHGIYSLYDDQLLMYFQSNIDTITKLTSVVKSTNATSDSILLSIWLYHWHCEDALSDIKLRIMNDKYHVLATIDTAINGHVNVVLPASQDLVSLYLEYQYESYYMLDTLLLDKNYQILLCIPEESLYTSSEDTISTGNGLHLYKEGEIMTFTVQNPILDSLFLMPDYIPLEYHYYGKYELPAPNSSSNMQDKQKK